MTYFVKTRNWHSRRLIAVLLNITPSKCVAVSSDFDNKYWIETTSPIRAWLTWLYWIILKPVSGGWTYIVRPGHKLGGGYKAIY